MPHLSASTSPLAPRPQNKSTPGSHDKSPLNCPSLLSRAPSTGSRSSPSPPLSLVASLLSLLRGLTSFPCYRTAISGLLSPLLPSCSSRLATCSTTFVRHHML